MADNTDREGEHTMFDMIRRPDDDQNEEEDYDGSEFLNNTGEGDMIFDHDEVMNDYDDDEEHDPETTNTDEVYIFI